MSEQQEGELEAALRREAALADVLRATSEILHLISVHPGDLRVVLDASLAKATELVGGQAGSIVASHGPAMEPYVGTTIDASIVPMDRVRWTGTVLHADDMAVVAEGIPSPADPRGLAQQRRECGRGWV